MTVRDLWRHGMIASVLTAVAFSAPVKTPREGEPVVRLPPFIVAEAKKPWRYVAGSKFEILSRCSDRVTRAFWERHERLLELLGCVLPDELQMKTDVPGTVLLVDDDGVSKLSEDVLAQFDAQVAQRESVGANGGHAQDPHRVEFLRNVALDDVDMRAVFAVVDEGEFDPDGLTFSNDLLRFVLERRVPALPPWFIEGFLTLHRSMHLGRQVVDFSPGIWIDDEETAALRQDPQVLRTLLPVSDLFERPAPSESGPAALQLWRSESALLIRWALDPKRMSRRERFWRFVARAAFEPVDEARVEEALGLDYVGLLDQLNAYVPIAVRTSFTLRPEKPARISAPRVRDATAAEVARIKGDWERLVIGFVRAHNPEYVPVYAAQALKTLEDAYTRGVHDAGTVAVLGLLQCDLQHDAEAIPLLVQASAEAVRRPRVHVELSRLRLVAALTRPAEADGRVSLAQVNDVLQPLAAARGLNPPLVVTYRLAAQVWAVGGAVLQPTHFAFLDEGVRLFPRDVPLLCYVAALRLSHGFRAEAAGLVERGLDSHPTAAQHEQLLRLRELASAGGSAPAR